MTPLKYYITHLNKMTGYRASWLPDKKLSVGDIGKMEDGIFTAYTTLEQQGIKCKTRYQPSTLGLDYSEKKKVLFSANADTGSEKVKGKVSIDFGSDNGLIFQMTGSKLNVIDNLLEIEREMLRRYASNDWDKSWVVISEHVVTDNATIIISTSNNNSIEFACDGDFTLAQTSLAHPQLGLKLTSESGSSTKIIGATGLTPLYKIRGIVSPVFSKPRVEAITRGERDFTLDEPEEKIQTIKEFAFDESEITR